jgi:hypothetical protein
VRNEPRCEPCSRATSPAFFGGSPSASTRSAGSTATPPTRATCGRRRCAAHSRMRAAHTHVHSTCVCVRTQLTCGPLSLRAHLACCCPLSGPRLLLEEVLRDRQVARHAAAAPHALSEPRDTLHTHRGTHSSMKKPRVQRRSAPLSLVGGPVDGTIRRCVLRLASCTVTL